MVAVAALRRLSKRRRAQLSGARSRSAVAIRASIKPLWLHPPLLKLFS